MAEKRTDIMEFIIRNNFIFNIPHFCVNGRVIFQKQGPKCWLFVDMRLKNQYYCIFVFNNNYITGSSAYEGGPQKDRYETREADRIKSCPPLYAWSECRDSNPGPHGPEPCAIPNFATPGCRLKQLNHNIMGRKKMQAFFSKEREKTAQTEMLWFG